MDCSPSGSTWGSPGKHAGRDCHFLLQGILPTQGPNMRLLQQYLTTWLSPAQLRFWHLLPLMAQVHMSLSNIVLLTNQFKITSSQNFQYFPLLCFSSLAPTLVTTIYFCPYFFIVSFLSLKHNISPKLWTFELWICKDVDMLSITITHVVACPHLLLMTLQLVNLPPTLPPPATNSSCLSTRCQPLHPSCCTGLLYFSRYCAEYCTVLGKVKNVFFIFVFNVLFVWKVL